MSGPPSLPETIRSNPGYFAEAFGLGRLRGAIEAYVNTAPPEDRRGLTERIMGAIMGVVPSSMTPVKLTKGGRRTRHHKSKRGHKKHRTTRRR